MPFSWYVNDEHSKEQQNTVELILKEEKEALRLAFKFWPFALKQKSLINALGHQDVLKFYVLAANTLQLGLLDQFYV